MVSWQAESVRGRFYWSFCSGAGQEGYQSLPPTKFVPQIQSQKHIIHFEIQYQHLETPVPLKIWESGPLSCCQALNIWSTNRCQFAKCHISAFIQMADQGRNIECQTYATFFIVMKRKHNFSGGSSPNFTFFHIFTISIFFCKSVPLSLFKHQGWQEVEYAIILSLIKSSFNTQLSHCTELKELSSLITLFKRENLSKQEEWRWNLGTMVVRL